MSISDSISTNEHNRLKKKLLIRTFVYMPISVTFAIFLYSLLVQGEMINFNVLLDGIIVGLMTVSLMWMLMDTDKQIKKEKQREFKRKNKSKKRIAIDYVLITLLLIVLVAYSRLI